MQEILTLDSEDYVVLNNNLLGINHGMEKVQLYLFKSSALFTSRTKNQGIYKLNMQLRNSNNFRAISCLFVYV